MTRQPSARASLVDTGSDRNVVPIAPIEQPIRIAVVGLGFRSVLSAIPKLISYADYELVAVCDLREQAVEAVVDQCRQEHGVELTGYTDFSSMLASEKLDAVCIEIDPDKQVALAVQAMDAGCHVMIEVPVTYRIEDCWDLVRAHERTGKHCLLMEQLRYSGYIRAWRKIIDSGVIGQVLYVEGEYFDNKPDAFFQDERGRYYTCDQAKDHPEAKPTWRNLCPPIGYLPHELSPLLYAIDDRVVRVTGMSTPGQSHRYDNLKRPDIQVALMQTAKGAILRMAVGHQSAAVKRGMLHSHWHHVKGSHGVLETPRAEGESSKFYVEGWELDHSLEVPWQTTQLNGPKEAIGSGHGDVDYFTYAHFADALRRGQPLEFDVYLACETAAPAILAAQSIAQNSQPLDVPDFRPGPQRKPGQAPPAPTHSKKS